MKLAPTLDGRIRIDLDSPIDLLTLQSIVPDARLSGHDLPGRLSPEPPSEDWREFVLPELSEGFGAQLGCIERAVAALEAAGAGPLFIVRDDAEAWYGGLNQARLALEARHHFSGRSLGEVAEDDWGAWFRGQLYQQLQEAILTFLMAR